jgi:hypothetical protein
MLPQALKAPENQGKEIFLRIVGFQTQRFGRRAVAQLQHPTFMPRCSIAAGNRLGFFAKRHH